jgi:macrolide transport system ATP-binding/permease protein
MFRRRKQREQDLERELQAHLDLEAEDQPDCHAAQRALGNLGLIKEDTRAMWGWTFLERLAQDVSYATRVLRRSPGFTTIAVLSLTLGIGANTALFSALDAVMWKSLPVRHPEQLRILTWVQSDNVPVHSQSGYGVHDPKTNVLIASSLSYPAFVSLRDHVPQFSDLVGFELNGFTVTAKGASEFADGQFVSGNYFTGLGVRPLAGRMLTPQDDASGAPPVVVLTYQYWQKRFGLDPQVIGRQIIIDQASVTVVGVTPPAFQGLYPGRAVDLFVPMSTVPVFHEYALNDPYDWWVQVFGRLRAGETEASASAAAQSVLARVIEDYAGPLGPSVEAPRILLARGARGVWLFRSGQESLYVLAAMVAAVLLIACANLANLLLARSQVRRREIAVRLSIGAGRGRLIRQLLTESLVLSGMAGVLGVLLANPLLELVLRMIGGSSGTLSVDARVDARTILFTFGVSIFTGVLFGILPAWRATRVDLTPALKDGEDGLARRGSRLGINRVLVAAQVAFSIVMLAGAGLFVRTLLNLMAVDVGFRTGQLLTFRTDPSRNGYEQQRLADVYARMRAKIEAIPGVASVGMSDTGLLQNSGVNYGFYLPGLGNKSGGVYPLFCSDSFLSTMRIPVVLGRDLSASDGPGSPLVAVVNETFVKQYLDGRNPIGQVFVRGYVERPRPTDRRLEIVGVVKDAHYVRVRDEVPPIAYVAYSQNADRLFQMTFAIRTNVPPLSIAVAVRKAVAEIDPTIPIAELRTMDDQLAENIGRERLMAGLVSGFGILAAMLAAIGVFGVMAYMVARRRREIGIRLALGATARGVRWMVLRESVVIVVAGLAIGVPAALALSRLAASLLYGVKPHDVWSFLAAALLMAAAGAAAAWIPARRASKVDPMVALRCE